MGTLKFIGILSMLAITADGGVVVQKCSEPLKCVPFAECSIGGQGDGDIVFNCNGARKDSDMVCCRTPPTSMPVNNNAAHLHPTSPGAPTNASAPLPFSEWISKNTSAHHHNALTKPAAASCGGSARTQDEAGDARDQPVAATTVPTVAPARCSCDPDGNSSRQAPPQQPPERSSTNSHSTGSSPGPRREDLSACEKRRLLPLEDCGLSTSLRITSGQNASFGQFPWMALLGYRLRDGTLSFLCGGTLINRQYVLTAAHCLESEGAILEVVRLGEHTLDTDPDCVQMETENYCADSVIDIPVETAISHEKFNSPYLKNDIGLLRLQSPVNSSTDYIRPICLPFGLNVTGLEEKKYQVAGWGKTDYYDSEGSQVLQFTGILSMPLKDCDSRQEKEVRPLDETQFCAGADMGRDACKGDSGGPLMEVKQAPSQSTAQTFQIGVVSFGSVPCGAKFSPSVYTRVTAYLDWILANIQP